MNEIECNEVDGELTNNRRMSILITKFYSHKLRFKKNKYDDMKLLIYKETILELVKPL